jgi:hypothetical protein
MLLGRLQVELPISKYMYLIHLVQKELEPNRHGKIPDCLRTQKSRTLITIFPVMTKQEFSR